MLPRAQEASNNRDFISFFFSCPKISLPNLLQLGQISLNPVLLTACMLGDARNKPSALRIMLDTTKALTDRLGTSSVAQAQLHQERMRLVEDQINFLNQIREKVKA